MKALSFQEPYAWLILQPAYEDNGHVPLKDIENRSWPLPLRMYGERIYVHASMTWYDHVSLEDIRKQCLNSQWWRVRRTMLYMGSLWREHNLPLAKSGYFRAILGEITLAGECEKANTDSPWAFGPHYWVLEDPLLYKEPVPCKGHLGFFNVPADVEALIKEKAGQ